MIATPKLSAGNALRSSTPAHVVLTVTSLSALAAAFFLAAGPLQHLFGFVPLPWPLLGAMAAVTLAYLVVAEATKKFALRGP